MVDEDLQVFGKDASVAPSTLEKGVEPIKTRRTRTRSTSSRKIYSRTVHPAVWEEVRKIRAKREVYVYVESEDCVWLLNHPAIDVDWL